MRASLGRLTGTTSPPRVTAHPMLTALGSDLRAAQLSLDARWLVAGLADDTLRVWCLPEAHSATSLGTPAREVWGGGGRGASDLSFDGSDVVVASLSGTVGRWSLPDGFAVWTTMLGIECVEAPLSADGRWVLARRADGRTFLLSAATGDCNRTFSDVSSEDRDALRALRSPNRPEVRSPDGQRVAHALGERRLRVDTADGLLVDTLEHPQPVLSLGYASDDEVWTVAADWVVRQWQLLPLSDGPA